MLGYTPTEAGLAFIPMAIASLIFNGVGAGLGAKLGNLATAVLGMVVVASGFGLLAASSDSFVVPGVAFLGAAGGVLGTAVLALFLPRGRKPAPVTGPEPTLVAAGH